MRKISSSSKRRCNSVNCKPRRILKCNSTNRKKRSHAHVLAPITLPRTSMEETPPLRRHLHLHLLLTGPHRRSDARLVVGGLHHRSDARLVVEDLHHRSDARLVVEDLHHRSDARLVVEDLHHRSDARLVVEDLHHRSDHHRYRPEACHEESSEPHNLQATLTS